MRLTRRQFIQLAAASGLGVTVLSGTALSKVGGSRAVSAGPQPGFGVLIDVARCIGCRGCEAACKAYHGFPAGEASDLSPTTWTYVRSHEVAAPVPHLILGADGADRRTYKVQCMHCAEPACASACPAAALRKTAEGPVTYDGARCLGCRYCMLACPFQVPRFEWNKALPRITKCNLCAERLAAGQAPACVEACPVEALEFGPRQALLAEAARRIAENGSRYVPAIYGMEEVGGTSVIYISDVPFEDLGFPVVVREPLPAYTWKALGKIPGLVVALGATLSAVEMIVRRRMQLQQNGGEPQ